MGRLVTAVMEGGRRKRRKEGRRREGGCGGGPHCGVVLPSNVLLECEVPGQSWLWGRRQKRLTSAGEDGVGMDT